jgi:hypothetical protein
VWGKLGSSEALLNVIKLISTLSSFATSNVCSLVKPKRLRREYDVWRDGRSKVSLHG